MSEEFRREFQGYQLETWRNALAALQPIEREATIAATEIIELESWFDDDLSCESVHVMTGIHNCQHTVTHHSAIRCRNRSKLVCIRAAQWNLDAIASGGSCAFCGRLTSECWVVTPI